MDASSCSETIARAADKVSSLPANSRIKACSVSHSLPSAAESNNNTAEAVVRSSFLRKVSFSVSESSARSKSRTSLRSTISSSPRSSTNSRPSRFLRLPMRKARLASRQTHCGPSSTVGKAARRAASSFSFSQASAVAFSGSCARCAGRAGSAAQVRRAASKAARGVSEISLIVFK